MRVQETEGLTPNKQWQKVPDQIRRRRASMGQQLRKSKKYSNHSTKTKERRRTRRRSFVLSKLTAFAALSKSFFNAVEHDKYWPRIHHKRCRSPSERLRQEKQPKQHNQNPFRLVTHTATCSIRSIHNFYLFKKYNSTFTALYHAPTIFRRACDLPTPRAKCREPQSEK